MAHFYKMLFQFFLSQTQLGYSIDSFQDYLDFPWIIGLPRITQKVLQNYKAVAGCSQPLELGLQNGDRKILFYQWYHDEYT